MVVADDVALITELVDVERYPIADPASARWSELVAEVRDELTASGCSVLRDFLRPHASAALRAECAGIAPDAYYDVETVNVYNTAPDPTLPPDHPAHRTVERGNAFVARDRVPPASVLARLYASPTMKRLVAAVFGLDRVYELADPLSGLCLNVVRPGRSHPWHFDTNEFTVSMLTQEPAAGGVFEYCPHLRSPLAENVDGVRAVLDGAAPERVVALPLRVGDLQLFRGRYSLHRVTTVRGDIERHSAILAYSERPDVIGTVERTRQLFGRVTPQHRAATARVDQLLD